jgi:hypothetical protein
MNIISRFDAYGKLHAPYESMALVRAQPPSFEKDFQRAFFDIRSYISSISVINNSNALFLLWISLNSNSQIFV